jgi:hypothetical protein
MPLKEWYLSAKLHGINLRAQHSSFPPSSGLSPLLSLQVIMGLTYIYTFKKKTQYRLFPKEHQLVLRISNDKPSLPDLIS